jgi:hypothetical protein
MNKVILEFTLNGRKHTYLRRIDFYGKPLTTTNIHSAKPIKENEIKRHVNKLIMEYGKNNITDINPIKME